MQVVIAEREHTTVRMVDNDNLGGAQQLLGNNQRTETICRSPTGVANDVSVSLFNAKSTAGVDACIHAGKHRYMPARRHRQISLVEVRGVSFICFTEFVCN
jgi:hypothetical protein